MISIQRERERDDRNAAPRLETSEKSSLAAGGENDSVLSRWCCSFCLSQSIQPRRRDARVESLVVVVVSDRKKKHK
eukprot:scaffold256_cov159-Amphora_coffeaeformis.AAC.5